MTPLRSRGKILVKSQTHIRYASSPSRRIMFFLLFVLLACGMIFGLNASVDLVGSRLVMTIVYIIVLIGSFVGSGWSHELDFDAGSGIMKSIDRFFAFEVRHGQSIRFSALRAVVVQKVVLLQGRDMPFRKSNALRNLMEVRSMIFRLFLEVDEERIKVDESSYAEEIENAATMLGEFLHLRVKHEEL